MKKVMMFCSVLLLTACGFEQVDTGYRGVMTRFGEVQGEALPEGLHFYNPFTQDIKEMSVQEQILDGKTECFTKDTQSVSISFSATYYLDPAGAVSVFRQFGHYGWEKKIIEPATLGTMKNVIGQYVADDLVNKREEARDRVVEQLKKSLAERNVVLTRVELTNLDFDKAYEQAVEAKVVATQKAAEAKNKTIQIEEQARQQVISAKAEAESMQIRSEALKQNKGLVEYEAVQKWDGKLPTYMLGGNSMPFINIDKSEKAH